MRHLDGKVHTHPVGTPRGRIRAGRALRAVFGALLAAMAWTGSALAADQPPSTGSTPSSTSGAKSACQQGAALEAASRFTEAVSVYEKAIAADPAPGGCGALALSKLVDAHFPERHPCVVATSLHKAGDNTSAKAVLALALKSRVAVDCSSQLLHKINSKSAFERIKTGVANLWWWAVALGVTGLLILLLLLVIPPSRRRVQRFANRHLPPQLIFQEFGEFAIDSKIATVFRALIGSRFVPESREVSVDQVDGAADLGDAFETLSKIAPQLGQLAAFAQLLQRFAGVPRRLSVAGQVLFSKTRGPGITLRISDQGASRCATTIWHDPPFDPVATIDDFTALIVPSVAWLRYEIAELLAPNSTARTTQSAVSYAYLIAGLDAQRHGDTTLAIVWFGRALAEDPTHLRARIALALAYEHSGADDAQVDGVLESTLFIVEAELASLGS